LTLAVRDVESVLFCTAPVRILWAMPEKTYLVRLKVSRAAFQQVKAVRAEIHGDHLVFVNSDGKLAALFLMEIVESWNEISDGTPERKE
jgi:hypothetical protein